MADMMTFPDTWEEFEELYHITDTEQIYTNGARLIPSFRVEQWLEHIADRKTEPQTCANGCKWLDQDGECTEPNGECHIEYRTQVDEPQKCYLRESCDHYGDKQVCGRCREYNLYSHTKTEPQHDYESAEPFEWERYIGDIKTEPQTCDTCEQIGRCDRGRTIDCPMDEPQTEDPPMDEYYKDHDEFYEPQTERRE